MPSARILVVDDTPSVRVVLRSLLPSLGDLEVVAEAVDGVDAVAVACAHHVDGVVLDQEMPIRNGLDVLPDLRAKLPDAVIVMFTSVARAELEESALAGGADAVVDKVDGPCAVAAALTSRFHPVG